MNKLHPKTNTKKVEAATKLAVQALKRYGEPTMELVKLRVAMDKELKGISLSELIIKERQSGW